MAEDVFPTIDQCIDAFTNEKDGAIVEIKKITDPASNKKHYYVSSAAPILRITTHSIVSEHI